MSFYARLTRAISRRLYRATWRLLRKREMTSKVLRLARKRMDGVSIGMYSYGCFDPTRIPAGTSIGRYCSFAQSCYRFNRNHGLSYISLHPYLYNTRLGVISHENISPSDCTIEDDVWIGHNAIILPSVKIIGRGSVVAAGSVVTKDVPRYAIVGGNPAKVLRYRFPEHVIEAIERTSWWSLDKADLVKRIRENPDFVYRPSLLAKVDLP